MAVQVHLEQNQEVDYKILAESLKAQLEELMSSRSVTGKEYDRLQRKTQEGMDVLTQSLLFLSSPAPLCKVWSSVGGRVGDENSIVVVVVEVSCNVCVQRTEMRTTP